MPDNADPTFAPLAVSNRAALADEQAQLVRALTGAVPASSGARPDAGIPPVRGTSGHPGDRGSLMAGFDETHVVRAAQALLHKRRRSTARAWPHIEAVLGERFLTFFNEYASAHPLPPGGASDDAFAFVRALDRDRRLPESLRIGVLMARCRSGFPVRVGLRRGPLRLLLAVRLPFRSVRGYVLPPGT